MNLFFDDQRPYSQNRSIRSRIRVNFIDFVVVDYKTLFSNATGQKLVVFEIMSTNHNLVE